MLYGLLLTIFTVVQLNCENLFDCNHDSLKNDYEFLPSSDRHYTVRRYRDKINKISKTITWCGCKDKDFHLPDIITLCEVENDSVLTCLTERSPLYSARYSYVMTNCADIRGIDIAILYNPLTFSPIRNYAVSIPVPEGMRPTRDILYMNGITINGDTLHVLAVHLPSKYGGAERTRPYRVKVAEKICEITDSIRSVGNNSKIIVAGDFNDDAESDAVKVLEKHGLTNISADACGRYGAKASYKYNGLWQSIDHIFISDAMKKSFKKCVIKDAPFLLESDKKYGGVKPRRFWNGYRYNKGFSDHLPLLSVFSCDVSSS